MLHLCRGIPRQNPPEVILKNIGKNYLKNLVTKLSREQRNIYTFGTKFNSTLRVSTTRGVPSTSTNLKEALCEKIPVHYDLLRNFRQQHGSSVVSHVTVENIYRGLTEVNAIVRETSEIDPEHGIKYRGLTIPEVITLLPRQGKSPSPEAVFWLLLTGDVPTQEQTSSLIADWALRRQKRKDWWSGPVGGVIGSVLQTLPNNVTPVGRLSVALSVLDAGRYMKDAKNNGAPSHTHWEYTYEDSMELLATLPAIVGLVAEGKKLKDLKEDTGDWVHFLLECSSNFLMSTENRRNSAGDFIRLYIALNADVDGGVPGAHVTQILGASQLDTNQALAAGILAYTNEPKSGTMFQYMDFQSRVQRYLGLQPKEETLKNFMVMLMEKNKIIGYKESEFCDPRYIAISNYVKEHLPDNADVKLSRLITRILTTKIKRAIGRNRIFPEQSALAAPVFQFYGLKDMNFNQVLLCMSRALGAVASIIWTRAVNGPVECPKSKCTYTYLESFQNVRKKCKRGRNVKRFK